MKHALFVSLLAAALGGCDSHLWENPNENVDPPTVIYRVTATPDTVAPGGWVTLECVVRDSLDPTITYQWTNASITGVQDLPRASKIRVQAPFEYDKSRPIRDYLVRVHRGSAQGSTSITGFVTFTIKQNP